ncbi:hypothetical protein [Natronorubrum tibetense]|uniref:Uncharacterized protein n=1 Tax=Natronorubrum tibetense GA33 TaxID=1114856 RepID=L9WBX2_9EURY|nr:hypothetical protein [Natronorubrum tibetense]ELY46857.1 hypothetical protein C496_00310 [Natronorubrum tibetense GA33]
MLPNCDAGSRCTGDQSCHVYPNYELVAGDGDSLVVGEPMSSGESVPVVMKTLAVGE